MVPGSPLGGSKCSIVGRGRGGRQEAGAMVKRTDGIWWTPEWKGLGISPHCGSTREVGLWGEAFSLGVERMPPDSQG